MTTLARYAVDPEDRKRMQAARREQDYDPDPPRCFTCIYYKREPMTRTVERTVRGRGGKPKTTRVKISSNPHTNPTVERCTFGNFPVTYSAVCDEWRNRSGDSIDEGQRVALLRVGEGS